MDPFLNTVVRGLASSFGFLCLFFSSFRNGVGNLTSYNNENKDIQCSVFQGKMIFNRTVHVHVHVHLQFCLLYCYMYIILMYMYM